MKKNFYVHNEENKIDLENEWASINRQWGDRFKLIHNEVVSYIEIYYRDDYFKGDCVVKPGDVVVDIGANIGLKQQH